MIIQHVCHPNVVILTTVRNDSFPGSFLPRSITIPNHSCEDIDWETIALQRSEAPIYIDILWPHTTLRPASCPINV